MSTLDEYLEQKARALGKLRERAEDDDVIIPRKVTVTAEGRSGIRRIRIRDFQVISDSPAEFAGYDLGPSSPELLLGALGSCLTHSFLIQAADLGIPLDALEVEIAARQDPRAGLIGKAHPLFPGGLAYTVRISSPASAAEAERLREAVERACPVLNFLQAPASVQGRVEHTPSGERRAAE